MLSNEHQEKIKEKLKDSPIFLDFLVKKRFLCIEAILNWISILL